MANEQVCIRTYPETYTGTTSCLNEYLRKGYFVVMCNQFLCRAGIFGNEYILEKRGADNAE